MLTSGKHKLENGACIGLDMRFQLGHPPEIVNAALLFDTHLETTKTTEL